MESLTLYGGTREWNVEMLDGGEPDAFVVNLNGKGLRLSGEPNPEPIGAEPDSLLRAANLERVVAAARKASPDDARISSFDVRPERVSFEVLTGGRTLALAYSYDAQLMNRDLRAATGARADDGLRGHRPAGGRADGPHGPHGREVEGPGRRPVRAARRRLGAGPEARSSRCTSRRAATRCTWWPTCTAPPHVARTH